MIRSLAPREVGFGLLEVLETALRQELAAGQSPKLLARPGYNVVRHPRTAAIERGNQHTAIADEHDAPARHPHLGTHAQRPWRLQAATAAFTRLASAMVCVIGLAQ